MSKNKIWIDLDNSPHVLFFNPIIKELERRGFDVVVTARDYAQVIELVELFGINYKKIGHHYGKNKIFKVIGFFVRSFQLLPFILKERPHLALSHGSRSQLLTAKIFRVSTVTAYDYEHARGIPFLSPDLKLTPDIVFRSRTHSSPGRISKYPGIKEDVYVQEYEPDYSAFKQLGVDETKVIVTIRPPAMLAHYHTVKSEELFDAVVNYLGRHDSVQMVIVPRTKDQELTIKQNWQSLIVNKKLIIPDYAINGLDLVWHSDLAISAGGTMIREAAALGVPAYSIFGGKLGAVDKSLSDCGRLTLIGSAGEIKTKIILQKRDRLNNSINRNPQALNSIIEAIESFIQ
jgi:hypothetical protein